MVVLAKTGDADAVAAVVEQSLQAVRVYVDKYAAAMRQSSDDLMQEIAIEIFTKWIDDYDGIRSKWNTFLYNKVFYFARDFSRCRVNSPACHYTSRLGRKISRLSLSMDINRDPDHNRPGTLADTIASSEDGETRDRALDIEHLIETTPKALDRRFLKGLVKGMTQAAIGEEIGVTPSRACQINRSVIKSLRSRLANRSAAKKRQRHAWFGFGVHAGGCFRYSTTRDPPRPWRFESLDAWRNRRGQGAN